MIIFYDDKDQLKGFVYHFKENSDSLNGKQNYCNYLCKEGGTLLDWQEAIPEDLRLLTTYQIPN